MAMMTIKAIMAASLNELMSSMLDEISRERNGRDSERLIDQQTRDGWQSTKDGDGVMDDEG